MDQGFYMGEKKTPAMYVPLWHIINSPLCLLSRDWFYVDAKGRQHHALAGMPTDGVSNPRLLWRVAGHPFSVWLPIAINHDHYCYKALCIPPGPERDALRLAADELMWDGCKFLKPEAPSVAWVIYRAVRCGAMSSRKDPVIPDYEHEPFSFYAYCGLQHLSMNVLRRRQGGDE